MEVLADVSASMQSGISGSGRSCGGAVAGATGGGDSLGTANLKGAIGGVSANGRDGGKRAR